ncbi:MAG: PRC-barrel domain-containing protein [Nitrosospira sp.]
MNVKHIQKIIIAAICSFSLIGVAAAQKDMTSAPGTNTIGEDMTSAPGTTAAPGAITTAPGTNTPAEGYNSALAPTAAESGLIATGWRVSKLNKATVYNDANEKVGKIDDFIVTKDGSLTFAVVNLGRFLGYGNYLVAVPIHRFSQIVPKVILPGKTKADLERLPRFEYKLILGK